MSRAIGNIVIVAACVAAGFFASRVVFPPKPSAATGMVTHGSQTGGPTIEQVRTLANLVTLHVPISDVQTSKLEGFTGSLTVALAVHGEVEIATDLSKARIESVDGERKTATIVLPIPAVVRPRLDHEKTRILGYERSGLWSWVNGQAGEETLTTRALENAQKLLGETALKPELNEQARAHAEEVLKAFFAATGWNVAVRWENADPIVPPADP